MSDINQQTRVDSILDMQVAATADQSLKAPKAPTLRLWPGLVIAGLEWLVIVVPAWVAPVTMAHFVSWFLGPIVGTVGLLVWWLFASRLPRSDRWLGLPAFVVVGAVTFPFWHHSLTDDNSKGLFFLIIYVLPVVTTAWVAWLVATPFLRWPVRRAGLVVVLLLAWSCFTFVRHEGTDGVISATIRLRGTASAEEQFLAEVATGKLGSPTAEPGKAKIVLQPGDWPGFRGPSRDSVVTGVRVATDWKAQPPRLIWRHRVGPGWSSLAVVGNRLYTQEQRGAEEAVVCYDTGSGSEVWVHKDVARFNETMAGPGPRATPTFYDGKIYAQGAAGRLNCLDAVTGRALWSRDLMVDSGAKLPNWGFSASPLIVQGVVSVFAGDPDGKSVLGYNASTGKPVWSAGDGKFSYCSLHAVRLHGVEQLLIATNLGLTSFQPKGGTILWQHDWPLEGGMARVVQPAQIGDADFLIGTSFGMGTRRIHVDRAGDQWSTKEVWTTRAIKPYFNDLIIHRDHLFGFDNNFLTCVSLADGRKMWKERGYGNGQILLLADQGLLLVLSEHGEVALVRANPDRHDEIARFQAIEGKTWNHPVVVRGMMFVRNGAEAACYELPKLTH